jgi:nicotinate-nucleotide adenylyltransferase
MKIGIFSGSFNPIHIGHMVLANFITEFTDIDEVWFLVTPQNPLKENIVLLNENIRFEMTKLALADYPKLKASDFEFSLPKPSYTIHTLKALSETYPENTFSLIIGADNWVVFDRWRDFEEILEQYRIYVYPRFGYRISISQKWEDRVEALHSPVIEISSTFIREALCKGKDMYAFLPESVYRYINEKELYR